MFNKSKIEVPNLTLNDAVLSLTDIASCDSFSLENHDVLDILQERISSMKKGEEALKQHNHDIWQDNKSGLWMTYLDDPEASEDHREKPQNAFR